MTTPAPIVDARTAEDVAAQVRTLLRAYAPAYTGLGLDAAGLPVLDGLGAALIGIFARFSELTIERLNRVPDKNLIAFLDLLGASRLAPQPARVPLTFLLAAGTLVPAVVPARTQAAAAPEANETQPTVFETERELVVTPALLTAVFSRDPEADAYADQRALATAPPEAGLAVFRGDRAIDHVLYVGLGPFLGFEGITAFTLTFSMTAAPGARVTQWERWDGAGWQPLPASAVVDGTEGLRRSGNIAFGALSPVPASAVDGIESRWLRTRLLTPIDRTDAARANMVGAGAIPAVSIPNAAVTVQRSSRPVDAAFTNQAPIDISKDFFPFGEIPRFGDTFWLRADEPFSKPGAQVVLNVSLSKPASVHSEDLTLTWEIGNDRSWSLLGTSGVAPPLPTASLRDHTEAFTRDGSVQFTVPSAVAETVVNGVAGFWLRVRLTAGNYGTDAHYEPDPDPGAPAPFRFVLANLGPPAIASITIAYALNRTGAPDALVTENDFTLARVTFPFVPFRPSEDDRPTAYLGFELPSALKTFPNAPVTVFARAADARYGEPTVPVSPLRSRAFGLPAATLKHTFTLTNPTSEPATARLAVLGTAWAPAPSIPAEIVIPATAAVRIELDVTIPLGTPLGGRDAGLLVVELSAEPGLRHLAAFVTEAAAEEPIADPAQLTWQYWNGAAWLPLVVRDASDRLARSGLLEFLVPPDFASRADFGVGHRYWVRVRWEKGEYAAEPRLRRLLLNTTEAAQTVTVLNEILGSSDGSKNQVYRPTRTPVLPGQRLQVHEPELPPAAERAVLEAEEGADALAVTLDASGKPIDIWVRWHEVTDFYGSGPRDRHYVIDRLTGEIRMGDGRSGQIPPLGAALRLAPYQTGGGGAGNRRAGVVVQLKTTVPYVDKVTNPEPATGGADAEALPLLLARAPKTVRHGGRAVTLEDYEDLALLASPEVARAKCVPLADLAADPLAPAGGTAGRLSVIVVPHSSDVKPLPSLELLRRVGEYLDGVRVPTAQLSVVGPLYVQVDIEAVVAVRSLESATTVLAAVQQTVRAFLHPLTGGGLDGAGWDFGRQPHASDVYALIEAVPGVDHVSFLKVDVVDPLHALDTGRFLVHAGAQKVSVVLEEA